MILTMLAVTAGAAEDSGASVVFCINYTERVNGTVNGKKTAYLEKSVNLGDKKVLLVTPNTVNHVRLGLDCHSLGYPSSYLAESNFVEIDYKYVCPEGIAGSKGRKMMFPSSRM